MSLKEKINSNPKLKKIVHFLLIPRHQARPRLWVKWFVNPFFHKKGKGVTIRPRTRMDVLPFNDFTMGDYSTIEDFSTVNNGVGAVRIGKRVRIGLGNLVLGPVTIGDNVIIGQHVIMSGLNHLYEDVTIPVKDQSFVVKEIRIEEDCLIGANSVITAGVTIGKHAVIAAGSIVTKDIPAFTLVVGNPARVIKKYDFEKKEWVKVPQA